MGGSLPFRSGVVVSLRPLCLSWPHVAGACAFLSVWVRYAGQFLAGHPASVCGYLRVLSLRVCCLVVLTVSLPLG